MIRKIPIWITIPIGAVMIGLVAVAFWTGKLYLQEVREPAEICLSNKFPGKSFSINELRANDLSVFSDAEFGTGEKDGFNSSFLEEPFEKAAFDYEKSIPEIAKADEIYRFSWLRTFHNPYMFRAYRIGDDKFFVTKETDGKGGYGLGSLILNKTQSLNDQEWCEFIHRLDSADFWNKDKIDIHTLANDGSFWTIEGFREQRVYVAGEQSPVGSDFREACIYLMKLSGLNIDENAPDFY